jgi:hypothetical protein
MVIDHCLDKRDVPTMEREKKRKTAMGKGLYGKGQITLK